jgi:hypothetical protein
VKKYIVFMLCTISISGYAQSNMNGEELLNFCEGNVSPKKTVVDPKTDCGIYIRSVIATERMLGTKVLKCAPQGITNIELSDLVVDYLKAHPNESEKPAATMIREAVEDKYPCQ